MSGQDLSSNVSVAGAGLQEAIPAPEDTALRQFSRLGGGANQAGGRAYNERLTLSLIRLNGALPKAELARLTGLTAQTLSHIIRRLEADGLVMAQAPVRGRIGQPSVPYALNARGALSFGVKLGRRSAEIVLCDFEGRILDRRYQRYAYPEPERVLAFLVREITELRALHESGGKTTGIGIATPFELWKWADEVEAPAGALDGWRNLDVAAALEQSCGLPTYLVNDATAACGAELAHHFRGSDTDLLYFFIGSFVGGGVVLRGALLQGRTGNAGALGSMPVVLGRQQSQLIHHASLLTLEKAVLKQGSDIVLLQQSGESWAGLGAALDQWLRNAAQALATAIVAGVSVIDFGHVCIDGALPRDVLARLVEETQKAIERHDLQGLSPFEIRAGSLGSDARVLGGAMLPIIEHYGTGQDILLKRPGHV